LVKVFAPVE